MRQTLMSLATAAVPVRARAVAAANVTRAIGEVLALMDTSLMNIAGRKPVICRGGTGQKRTIASSDRRSVRGFDIRAPTGRKLATTRAGSRQRHSSLLA